MKKLLLLLLPITAAAQNTIPISPYNLGGNWRARNDSMIAHLQVKYSNPLYATVDIWFCDTYTYSCSDSSFILYDMFSDSVGLLTRYVEPPICHEASMETNWYNFKKDEGKKLTVKGYKFTGWGLYPKGKPLSKDDMDLAKSEYKILQANVDAALALHGNKEWKDKDNKVIAKKDKRKYAWKLMTKKEDVKINNVTPGKETDK